MTDKPRLLVTVPVDHLPEIRTLLEAVGPVTYLRYPPREETRAALADAEGLFCNVRVRLDEDLLSSAPRLRVIGTPSIGTDHIDLDYCRRRGIAVLSLSGAHDALRSVSTTAEHAFGLMLAIVKNMPWSFNSVVAGEWRGADFCGRDLQGRTLGIVGCGLIGSRLARYGLAFEMRVLAYDPFVTVRDPVIEQVDLPALLARAEIISLHAPLTEATRGMVDRRWFDQMNGTYLINTSRGCVIHEADLLAALESARVKAAGLDVLCDETEGNMGRHPMVEYARSHSNVMITPHCAGASVDGQRKTFGYSAGRLAAFFSEGRR